MGVTEALTRFLLETKYEDFPREAVDRAKHLAIDFVGGALAGCRTHVSNIFTDYVKQMAAKPEAVVIGRDFRTTAQYASYLNGVFNHSTELEAVSQRTSPNPLAVIATSLSVGDRMKLPGKKVLEGLILGFEIQGRVGGSSLKGVSKRGRISIFNHLGTASAASKLMGLNLEQARMAIGTAAFQAGGLITTVGTMAHVTELAYGSRDGIEAAELARKGFTSHPDIIETPQGFCDALIEDGGYDLNEMTRDLGKTFQIVNPGISVKKYPCCYRSHRALDAFYDMVDEHHVSRGDIEKVIVEMNLYDSYLMKFPEPKTGEEAKFSFPHIFGAALLKGKVWIDSFSDEAATDRRYAEARGRVEEVVHRDWPPGRVDARIPVTIKLKDGRAFTKENASPREPTSNQLLDRYREAADGVLTPEQTKKSIALLQDMENSRDFSEIMGLLGAKS
ncbi:MAG: MmgE/PrpD family protein [Betaproteobacteria bacterium]|nr:MmgE/PrpD family protein [Betaproteobacteria bacterium]